MELQELIERIQRWKAKQVEGAVAAEPSGSGVAVESEDGPRDEGTGEIGIEDVVEESAEH